MLYILTYKGKPITLERLHKLENHRYTNDCQDRGKRYMSASTKSCIVKAYLRLFGWTWPQRTPGIQVSKAWVGMNQGDA